MNAGTETKPVLFFDGVCNLCNGAVQFFIRHDKAGNIRFASLQSPAGQAAIAAVSGQSGQEPDSLIFLEGGRYYTHSEAALRAVSLLDRPWRQLRRLRIFPLALRNGVYRFIARNRYRLWGKKDTCMIPSPALRERFLPEGAMP